MKITLAFLLMFLSAISAWSNPVDVETARQHASAFFLSLIPSDNRHRALATRNMRLAHVRQATPGDEPLLYVFVPDDGAGYAIVAGEDIDNPVLAYSEKSEFRADSIPEGVQYWLDEYSRQLAFLRSLPEGEAAPVRRDAIYKPRITPFIKSKWNQGSPYNNLCPIDQKTNARCITGCVATAMAQVMYYHHWPQTGHGSHSYECQGQTLTAEFGKTMYQWDKMKNTYTGSSTDENDAVATLMYHCGVAVEMDYTSTESAAWVGASILRQYFRYANTTRDVSRDAVEDSVFEAILYAELQAKRPVLFSGSNINYGGGHEFICDGYQNGYFHFNMGWGGWDDDYYQLGYILPASTSCNFSYNQTIICGIQPPGDVVMIDGVYYELYPDGTAILQGGTVEGDYTIPTQVSSGGKDYTVIAIDEFSFYACSNLASITIPASVTMVGDSAFYDCTSLRKVTLEESSMPLSFGYDVFGSEEDWCPVSLEEVVMNRNITNCPFNGASNLKKVSLGDKVTELPYSCFWGCSSLEHLTLPKSCRTVREGALACCDALKVEVAPGNPYLYVTDDVLFQRDGNVLLFYPAGKTDKTYTVPEGVAELMEYAFYWAPLQHIILPSTLKTVGWASLWLFQYEDIVCLATTPPAAPSYVFPEPDVNNKPILYVPEASVEAYKKATPWNQLDIRAYVNTVGIEAIVAETSGPSGNSVHVECFAPDGRRLPAPRRGINLMRLADGTIKKVYLK